MIRRGILLMCAGVASMVGLDVTAKTLLETYGLAQLVFLRCLFSVVFIFAFAVRTGGWQELATERPGWHLLRSVFMAGSMTAFFYALPRIPLADVLTIAFVAPLIVTALSQPVLGEPVGPWRWAAVAVGFGGVLVLLRPEGEVFQLAGFLALGGTALYALLSLTARKLSATESTSALSFYLFGAPLLIGAIGSVWNWRPPDAEGWLLFAMCGGFGGMAFVLINAAFRHAEAAILVPFEYTGLIWAAGAGYVFWSEVPSVNTWIGATIIASSGLFILYRETVSHRASPQADFPVQEAVATPADSRIREP
ncbi:MAG: DMT family transporter [Gammaproteobacteria bacterium]|nr:DMT family transporter [Gammaproteobacteria bacterium]